MSMVQVSHGGGIGPNNGKITDAREGKYRDEKVSMEI
jgi:hypothetical protein